MGEKGVSSIIVIAIVVVIAAVGVCGYILLKIHAPSRYPAIDINVYGDLLIPYKIGISVYSGVIPASQWSWSISTAMSPILGKRESWH